MKGIEIYRGKPIFYSLGNFAIEQPHIWDPAITGADTFRHLVSLNPSWSMESVYMLPEETRLTGLAQLRFAGDEVQARFLPAWIDDASVPHMLTADDARFEAVRAYLEEATRMAGLATRLVTEGNEVTLTPA